MCVYHHTDIFFTAVMSSSFTFKGDAQLDPEDKFAYEMSQQAYNKPDQRAKEVDGYEYDPTLSDENTVVYHNHGTRKTHVSNRGSITAYDWGVSDAQIATGTEDRGARFQKAVKRVNDAHTKHGYSVSTSGHSLGGSLSNYQTEKLGNNGWYEKGTTFNSGVSTLGRGGMFSKQRRECRRKSNRPAYCDKSTNVKERGDYISNNNVACDYLTFGFGGSWCRKSDAFGKTKTYDHRQSRRWRNKVTGLIPGYRFVSNLGNHSLSKFN